jgi:hypothetical protein
MIRLQPLADSATPCPACGGNLQAQDWHIVATRTFGAYTCASCQHVYYQDLPVGHGNIARALWDVQAQSLINPLDEQNWYVQSWQAMMAKRTSAPVSLEIETHRILGEKPIVVLNTIDHYYGHSLLKLLNEQAHLDHQPDVDVVVLVQPFMRWLVPDGVAQIITAKIPLREGDAWYEDLDAQLHTHFASYKKVYLSKAFSHPDAQDFDITRFTGIKPFVLDTWQDASLHVSFIWRDDRTWHHPIPIGKLRNLFVRRPDFLTQQKRRFFTFADELKRHMPDVSLALIGTTSDDKRTIPDLPSWVNDMRATHMNDDIERAWVAQYARSHIVVGVHGSNMLLPTAHAGASVTLMPIDRWGNMVQDTIVTEPDPRMSQVRHKHIPIDTLPETLARIVVRTYRALPHARQHYERTHTQHDFTLD